MELKAIIGVSLENTFRNSISYDFHNNSHKVDRYVI